MAGSNWAQRYALLRSHPRFIIFRCISFLWFTYFLWNQDWKSAVGAVVICSFIGLIAVWNVDPEPLSKTTLGKLALLHLHPANFFMQVSSVVPLTYGIWTHSVVFILLSLSILFLGHFFGWEMIDQENWAN